MGNWTLDPCNLSWELLVNAELSTDQAYIRFLYSSVDQFFLAYEMNETYFKYKI